MTIAKLANRLHLNPKLLESRALSLLASQQLRFVESGLLEIMGKYGVKTLEDLDKKIASGALSEDEGIEDFYRLDFLAEKKRELETLLKDTESEPNLWTSIKSLAASPRWNLAT